MKFLPRLIIILLLFAVPSVRAQLVNVAQGKPTTGDTAFAFPTSNGVDGTTSTFTHANNTNAAPNNPYWQVDLTQNYNLTRLEITDRSDGCCSPNRLNGSEIRVYDANNMQIGATIPITGLSTPSSSQTLVFTNGATGWPGARRIRIDGYVQYFQFAEFRAFTGQPVLTANLALNGVVTSSGATWPGQPASNLTDGNPSTFSHPATGAPFGAYYTVDLGATYALERVVLFNRTDCCSDRLSNYRVQLLADNIGVPGVVNWSGNVRTDGTDSGVGGSDTVRVANGVGSFIGRFIRVTDLSNVAYKPQIAEIEAYAPVPATIRYFLTDAGNIGGPGMPAGATLSWSVVNATSVSISSIGTVPASGTIVVAPGSATTYILTATRTNAANSVAAVTIAVNASALPPKITEFQAADGIIEDENGDRPDWIELQNPNTFTLNLAGYTLTDSALLPAKWTFPLANIAPGGYALVYASGKNRAITGSPLHTNFSLTASGEYLALSAPGGALVQRFPADYPATLLFPKQYDRVTYGITAGGATKYFKPATPGAANGTSYDGVVADTSFSVKRGIYSTPQSVAITSTTAGATIRYTTDGTEPTETTGTIYTTPIAITTTTMLRALAHKTNFAPTNVDTNTYIFPAAVVASPVMSTTITQDPTYGPQMIAALTDLPSISVVAPSAIVNGTSALCSFEYIPAIGAGVQENAGIELFGGAYTNFQKKSFRVAFKADYGAANIEIPDLFTRHARGWKPVGKFDSLELRSGSHDMAQRGFYMSNLFTDGTMLDMGALNPHSRFVHLYLNGSYWGMYHLRERWDADMHSAYLGGPSGDYESINGNLNVGGWAEPGDPYDGDGSSWTRVKSLRANYTGVSPYLDVAHYVDYMLMFAFGKSEEEYRTVSPKNAGSGFKFLLNDADGYLASSNYINSVPSDRMALRSNPNPGRQNGDGPGGIFSQLWQQGNSEYKMLLADHIHRHFFNSGALTPAATAARLTGMCNEIQRAFYAESARWVGSGESRTPATWATERDNILNNFLPTRTGIYLSQLQSLGYYPSVAAPAFGGGIVASGTAPSFAVAGATVYFTKDGSDPRLPGGAVNPAATLGTSTIITANSRLCARALSGSTWSALNEAFYTVTTPLAPGDIVFSEIHYNPQGDDDSEFIELWNPTTHAVNLRGAKFTAGLSYDFPDNRDISLAPGERIVLVSSLYNFQQRYGINIPVAGVYFDRLGNDGDTLTLTTGSATDLISLQYQDIAPWPETADGNGYSLVLANVAAPTLASSWRTSTAVNGNPGTTDAAFPFTGTALADADKDGIPALLEHFFVTNDTISNRSPLTAGRTLDGRLQVTFPRRLSADDLTLTVEVSTDLSTWTTAATRTAHINNGDGTATETWTADAAANAQFIRLRVAK